jgi:heptosyltransferase-2
LAFSRILVRATNWVGDAVMSLPALRALRAAFPAAHLAVLARPWVADLYAREPFDEVILYDAGRGWRDWAGKRTAAARLRSENFDTAILFQNAFDAALVAWLARIPRRIGYARDGRSFLLTDPVRVPGPGEIPRHQRFYYLELLKRCGIAVAKDSDAPVRLEGAAAAREAGERRLAGLGIRLPLVGVSPGAAYGSAKRWPAGRFAESARHVARELRVSIAVFGSAQERELCERVAEACGGRCLAGDTSLRDFIEMAAACRVFLTNDSGAMHIASALGVPTVAVFGATDHVATGPAGPNALVVRQPVECSPCLLRECPIDHRCMTAVEPRRVAEAAFELLR